MLKVEERESDRKTETKREADSLSVYFVYLMQFA